MEPRQFNQRRGQTRVGGSQRVFPNRLIVPLNPLGLESGSSFALECIRVAPLPADLLIYSTTKMGRHRETAVNRADVWTLTFAVQRIFSEVRQRLDTALSPDPCLALRSGRGDCPGPGPTVR